MIGKATAIAEITVGLRDDIDAYLHEHDRIPPRAWILSQILIDENGDKVYTEETARDLPIAEAESVWNDFQEALTSPQT